MTRIAHLLTAAFMLLALALVPAQAQDIAAPGFAAPASAPTGAGDLANGYILGPGDIIEVSVLGQADYAPRVSVQTDGSIQLPFIGNVDAEGETVLALREEVGRRLRQGGYFTNPAVNVAVVGYASRYVIVLGEVASPGIIPIDRAYRVSEILARAGGMRDSAAEAIMLRRENGQEMQLDLRQLATGGPNEDPYVQAGDKLFVDKASTFYVYGQVNAPGVYKLDPGMSVRMALARGGGLTVLGTEKRIELIRQGKEMGRVSLATELREGDVVVVGERFF